MHCRINKPKSPTKHYKNTHIFLDISYTFIGMKLEVAILHVRINLNGSLEEIVNKKSCVGSIPSFVCILRGRQLHVSVTKP